MIKIDEYLMTRILNKLRETNNEDEMLDQVHQLNRESLVRPANNSTKHYTVFNHNDWTFVIDTMRGSIMLIDYDDLDFISEYGMPSVKGKTYVTKFVTRSITTHMRLAEKHGIKLNGMKTPIHHLNGHAFDNRKQNLVVCNGGISHCYLHREEGRELNKILCGGFKLFSVVGPNYWLDGVAYAMPVAL